MESNHYTGDDNTQADDMTDAEFDARDADREAFDRIKREQRDHLYVLVYPDRRTISGWRLIGWAKDHLATEYMRANPHAGDAAIEENARVSTVAEAIELLEDAGVVTLARQ